MATDETLTEAGEEHTLEYDAVHDVDPDEELHHSSHRHEEHEEGGHGEPWLVSYADLMTLLFGFFVLMYSFEAAKSRADASSVIIRKELAQFFGGGYVNPLNQVAADYKNEISQQKHSKDVAIKELAEGLEITFQSATLFESGSADLSGASKSVVAPLVQMVKEQHKPFSIRVEGYTDDNPIRSERYPSNWELSGARASTVLRMFEDAGFDPDKLTALGFGATRPAHPNRDAASKPLPENQARNRRVKIFIINELDAETRKTMNEDAGQTREELNKSFQANPEK